MNEAEMVLAEVPQADGSLKKRPAVILRVMPPFGDLLACGVSTQLHQEVVGFDEVLSVADADFRQSGLRAPSLIRLGYLVILPRAKIVGTIGTIATTRHRRLLEKLAAHLLQTTP